MTQKQLCVELCFKQLDAGSYMGLDVIQGLGCAADAAMFTDTLENLQIFELHKIAPFLSFEPYYTQNPFEFVAKNTLLNAFIC